MNKEENISATILQARFGSELWKYFFNCRMPNCICWNARTRNAKKDLVEVGKWNFLGQFSISSPDIYVKG